MGQVMLSAFVKSISSPLCPACLLFFFLLLFINILHVVFPYFSFFPPHRPISMHKALWLLVLRQNLFSNNECFRLWTQYLAGWQPEDSVSLVTVTKLCGGMLKVTTKFLNTRWFLNQQLPCSCCRSVGCFFSVFKTKQPAWRPFIVQRECRWSVLSRHFLYISWSMFIRTQFRFMVTISPIWQSEVPLQWHVLHVTCSPWNRNNWIVTYMLWVFP